MKTVMNNELIVNNYDKIIMNTYFAIISLPSPSLHSLSFAGRTFIDALKFDYRTNCRLKNITGKFF